ncbi:MAG: Glycerate 2-kinase [Candidatus Celerinatantimonas neptuna]|nr:MAG: Glycerate 2-kinase [Candidatus Celerinatantimonas neptuna]
MKIIVAPDSFKESLSAPHAAKAIIDGFSQIYPDAEFVSIPLADGGEGTVAAVVSARGGRVERCTVHGARMTEVESFWGMLDADQTAVIEVAAACGLEQLAPTLRNPRLTTSYGVGELIRFALDAGATRILVGLGGSASNDAGAGMLQALGVGLLDEQGEVLPVGGAALANLATIDMSGLDPRLKHACIEVACDVDNTLCGPKGASFIFGPQKGADVQMTIALDKALENFARCCEAQLHTDLLSIIGGGAAGGLGAALSGLLGAKLRSGIDLLVDLMAFDEALDGADLVITGEGRLDGQSISGKTPVGVARRSQDAHIPVIAIAGSLGPDYQRLYDHGITAIFSCVNRVDSLSSILATAEQDLLSSARNVAALWSMASQA